MPEPSDRSPAERHRARAIALWATFTALLLLGIILYYRFGGRILPLLDAVSDR